MKPPLRFVVRVGNAPTLTAKSYLLAALFYQSFRTYLISVSTLYTIKGVTIYTKNVCTFYTIKVFTTRATLHEAPHIKPIYDSLNTCACARQAVCPRLSLSFPAPTPKGAGKWEKGQA